MVASECAGRDLRDPNLDVYLENIRNMIIRCAEAAIPKKDLTLNGKVSKQTDWWNFE